MKLKTNAEIFRSIRKSWNGVNPVTKVDKMLTRYTRKAKHKKQQD